MNQIRNHAVAKGGATLVGNNQLYVVPAGFALILKFVGLRNATAGSETAGVFIYDGVTGAVIYLYSQSVTAGQSVVWSGWTVLNANDQIQLNIPTPPFSYWVAGALLPYAPVTSAATEATSQPEAPTTLPESPILELSNPAPPTIYLPPTENPVYVSAERSESRAPEGRRAKRGHDS